MDKEQAISKLITELKLEGSSKYTVRNYTYALNGLFEFTKKQPEKLTIEDARQYIATLFDKNTVATVSLTASALRYFYSEILDKPIGKIKIPKKESSLPQILTREEIDKVILAAPTKKSQLMIRLMYPEVLDVSVLVNLES